MLPRLAAVLAICLSLVSCLSYTSVYQKRGTEPPFPAPGTMTVTDLEQSRVAQLDLEARSVERFRDFELGVLEITDDGLVNSAQKKQVFDMIEPRLQGSEVLLVVFVHGWHHGPHVCDRDLACFRRVMERLATSPDLKRRNVVVTGLYIGWRGESIRTKYLNNLSFWDRKNTAQHVGRTGAKEILLELDAMYSKEQEEEGKNMTMVTVGHSFGGALVFSAMKGLATGDAAGIMPGTDLTQTYRVVRAEGSRVDAEKKGVKALRARLGDLVVLVNPAIEAAQYKPFSADLPKWETGKYGPPPDKAMPYDPDQLPVLMAVASEADAAVGVAFPAGRWVAAIKEPDIATDASKRQGIGHYEPHVTHRLTYPEEPFEETPKDCGCPKNFDLPTMNISEAPLDLHTTAEQNFGDLKFAPTRPEAWDVHSPYLVVSTNKGVIREHSDIYNPVFVEFLTKFIRAYYARSIEVEAAQ